MAINVYGRKVSENNEEVIYSFGSEFNNLSGKLSINKHNLEVRKISDAADKLGEIAYFKIGCKVCRRFNSEGDFPDFVESIS